MKISPIVVVMVFLLFAWQPASAEFYRYVDEHGNILYTDDISNVPVAQREKADSYEDSRSTPIPNVPKETKEVTNDLNDIEKERKALEDEQKRLDEEYEALKKERADLQDLKEAAVTPEMIKRYNEKSVAFNARAKALQEKNDEYSEKAKSFNERIKSAPTEPKKSEEE